MAYLEAKHGTYYAKFCVNGSRMSAALPPFRNKRHARKLANELEAHEQFQANLEYWRIMAHMRFSARYMYQDFIGKAHVQLSKFREWLQEADIDVLPDYKCRDFERKPTGKKYRYKGKDLTVSQLIQHAKTSITVSGLRFRLKRGWKPEEALSAPPATFAQAGRAGANRRWRR